METLQLQGRHKDERTAPVPNGSTGTGTIPHSLVFRLETLAPMLCTTPAEPGVYPVLFHFHRKRSDTRWCLRIGEIERKIGKNAR